MKLNYNKKAIQRRAGVDARNKIEPTTAATFSALISTKLHLSDFAKINTILSYQAFGGEVDVSGFNEWAVSEGKIVAFPICYEKGKMVAAFPNGDDAWETGKYGIRTPVESRSVILSPEDIELVIVPCTAFCAVTKMRCGMGAGYYDRFLPKCKKAVTVSVAFESQRIDDLHIDNWDIPLDHIVTENSWY